MKDLTERQKDLLNFIHSFIEENGYFPLMREISEKTKESLGGIHPKFRQLVTKGYVKQVSPKKFILNEVIKHDKAQRVR